MGKAFKGREILSIARKGIFVAVGFFCLGTTLIAYLFPIPPTLLIFSPKPPETLDFSMVDEIIIDDAWGGLAPYMGRHALYSIIRKNGVFIGEANFSVGMFDPINANVPLSVPTDDIRVFTELLAQSKLEKGIYIPNRNATDDNPSIEIILKYQGQEVARFASISQGETRVPWKVAIYGHDYIVQSDAPAKALGVLEGKLKQDVLKSLIEQYGD